MGKGICRVEGCDGVVQGKRYCVKHYRLWRKGKMPKPRYKTCNAEGCRKPRERRGLCAEHFAKEYGKQAQEEAAA